MKMKRILSLLIALAISLCNFEIIFASSDNVICKLYENQVCSIYNTSEDDYINIIPQGYNENEYYHGDDKINYVVYHTNGQLPEVEREVSAFSSIYCPAGARCDIELVKGSSITIESESRGFTYSSLSHSPVVEYTLSQGERIRAHCTGAADEIHFAENPSDVELSYISYDGETRCQLDLSREWEFNETALQFFEIYTTAGGDIDMELVSGEDIIIYGAYDNFVFQSLDHELFKEFKLGQGESVCIKHNNSDWWQGGSIYWWPNAPSQDYTASVSSYLSYNADGSPYFIGYDMELIWHKEDSHAKHAYYIPPHGTVDIVFGEGMGGHFFGAYENYDLVTSTDTNLTYSNVINNASMQEPVDEEDVVTANSLGITSDSFNITSADSDTLMGPELSILGKKFNLFELPLDFKIETPYFSTKYNVKDEKYEIIIGAIDKTKIKGEDKIHETFMEVKEFANSIGKSVGKSGWKKYDHLKRLLKRSNADIGFEFNAHVVGYMEFDKNGNPLEGSIVYLVESDASYKQRFVPAPVFYLKIGIEAEASGKIGVRIEETNNWELFMKLALEIAPYVGLGAGEEKIANAEVGAKLKLGAEFDVVRDKKIKDMMSVTAAGSLYFKIKALSFINFERDFDIEKVSIYPDFGASLLTVADTWDDMVVIPRDYMKEESVFMGNDGAELMGNNGNASAFKTNVYPYAEPQLVELYDGKKLMVWVDNDPNRNDINCTVLKYSYYDGEKWSEPADIYNDGRAEFEPSLAATANGAVLVWQKANSELDDDATIQDMAKEMDIYYANFSNGYWTKPNQLTSYNEDYEFAPVVAAKDESYVVSWITNSENDCFGLSGTNSIWCKEYSYGWQQTTPVAKGLGCVSDVTVSYTGDDYVIAYTTDKDGKVETNSDAELYEYTGGQIIRVTKDDIFENSLSRTDEGYCWIHGNQMWERNAEGVKTVDIPVSAAYLNNAKIYDGETKRVIVYEKADGFSSEICALYYDLTSDKWGEPVNLTNDGKKIRDISGYVTSNDELCLVFGQAEVDEDAEEVYGICNLMMLTAGDKVDISVEDAACYIDNYQAGAEVKVYADVKNNGSVAVDNINIKIETEGMTAASDIEERILPGETATVEVGFSLGDDLSHRSYDVTVSPVGYTDAKPENNKCRFETGFSDVEISASADGGVVNAVISNTGVLLAENVKCSLSDLQGNVIEEKIIGEIGVGETQSVSFDNIEAETVVISLTSDSKENLYANNNATLRMTPIVPKGMNIALGEYSATSKLLNVSTTVSNDSGKQDGATVYIAYYKDDRLVHIEYVDVTLNGGEAKTILGEVASSLGVNKVKIFILYNDGTYVPYNVPVELEIKYPDVK